MKLFYPVIFAFASKTLQLLFVRRRLWWLLSVWLCCSLLFCAINRPAFPGLFVLIFLWAVLKKVKMLLFEVFRSYSWQGMGFVPASICCLEPFPVGRLDPGAPSLQRGAERHLRTETSTTCAWLQGHSSASTGICACWKMFGIEKSLCNEMILSKCLGNSWWLCTAALPLQSNATSIPMGFLWILWIFFSLPS